MKIALGELRLKPEEFYNLTPFEFYTMRDARRIAEDNWWTKAGFLAFVISRDVMATKGKLKFKEIQDALVSDESKIRERVEKEHAFNRDFEKGGE